MRFWLALTAVLLMASSLTAEPIYSWRDDQGVVHYSSKPGSKDAAKANLPPITKAEMKIPQAALSTCNKHGGVNCQAGADTDGSVICYDGFRGSMQRFTFTCNAPKLEIADVSDVAEDGSFSVYVRNSRGVTASDPKLTVKTITGKALSLNGPTTIDAFGLAEFLYPPDPKRPILQKPTMAQIDATCANCPG